MVVTKTHPTKNVGATVHHVLGVQIKADIPTVINVVVALILRVK
jgi:hypothetical protein